ncbi:relaxase/mobilization nuclease domain-containing protein [Flavitalea sp. BT771]|nr:relaxase/mobilization nuclease domain-containing protein [Flavitalea sp. BT771]MDO6431544.1 relaxase/mobilization nuclease domain-containing protein [Flavitalea sp. BT771]MDV6220452.1 relaxase/mobilization nuclease domain-containing protein [Flavitalea sp. BT771]
MKNFLQDKNSLTYAEKVHRFQHLNELNTRAKLKMLHATLNFEPSEKLSNTQLADITDRYMQGLQMQDHPYLVYRHQDAKHPHVHIVASLIRSDGTRVNTHLMAPRLSEPTRKAIEQEFSLQPSQQKQRIRIPPIEAVQKIVPGDNIPVTQAMDRILGAVNRHYHFANLHEYNAILRAYNVTAETGSPGSKTHLHKGIYYTALDDHGNKISPPVMASQLTSRPTLSRLNEKFHQPAVNYMDNLSSIRQRIDWALDQQPETLRELLTHLQADAIEIVTPPRNGRNPHDYVYVDHRTRTAVTGNILGPAYTTSAVTAGLTQHHRTPQHKQSQQQPDSSKFNSNTPQLLSALLHTDPGGPGPDPYQQDLGHAPRRKR